MQIKTLLALALGAFAAWQLTARRDDRQTLAAAENAWEDEGGALPVTGAQLGPEPTVP